MRLRPRVLRSQLQITQLYQTDQWLSATVLQPITGMKGKVATVVRGKLPNVKYTRVATPSRTSDSLSHRDPHSWPRPCPPPVRKYVCLCRCMFFFVSGHFSFSFFSVASVMTPYLLQPGLLRIAGNTFSPTPYLVVRNPTTKTNALA